MDDAPPSSPQRGPAQGPPRGFPSPGAAFPRPPAFALGPYGAAPGPNAAYAPSMYMPPPHAVYVPGARGMPFVPQYPVPAMGGYPGAPRAVPYYNPAAGGRGMVPGAPVPIVPPPRSGPVEKREKKPLIITDPKTMQQVLPNPEIVKKKEEVAAVAPAAPADSSSEAVEPALTAAVPPVVVHNEPSARDEMLAMARAVVNGSKEPVTPFPTPLATGKSLHHSGHPAPPPVDQVVDAANHRIVEEKLQQQPKPTPAAAAPAQAKPPATPAVAPSPPAVAAAAAAAAAPVTVTTVPAAAATPVVKLAESPALPGESEEERQARLRYEEALKKKTASATKPREESGEAAKPAPAPTRDYDPSTLKKLTGTSAFAPQGAWSHTAPAVSQPPKNPGNLAPTAASSVTPALQSAVGLSGGAAKASASGKKVYSVDQLFELRELEACKRLPIDIEALGLSILTNKMTDAFKHRPQPSASRGGLSKPPRANWGQGGKPPTVQLPAVDVSLPPLTRSENAWKPTKPSDGHMATMKQVKGILNKLTLENFVRLSEQLLEIKMTSMTMLQDVIAAIFDKALSESHFGPVYADLCKEISDKSGGAWDFVTVVEKEPSQFFWTSSADRNDPNCFVGTPEGASFKSYEEALKAAKRASDFKRLLLSKCQVEFEKNVTVELKKRVKELKESLAGADAERTAELNKEIDSLESKITVTHKRVLGNMSFIGELYRKRMITSRIINTCIVELVSEAALENPEEFFATPGEDRVLSNEDVECLTKLLKTVGYDLDQGEFKPVVSKYFKYLSVLERQPFLDVRHKFMVQDLAELRANDWQERRVTLKVKTKDEVKADYDNEEIEAQRKSLAAQRGGGGNRGAPPPRGQPPRGGNAGRGVMGTLTQENKPSGGFGRGPADVKGKMAVPVVRAVAKPTAAAATAATPSAPAAPAQASVAPLLNSSSSSSASPAPSASSASGEAGSLTRDQAKQKLGAIVDEWLSEHNTATLLEDVKRIESQFSSAAELMVTLTLNRIIDRKDKERAELLKLLPEIKSSLPEQAFVATCSELAAGLPDLVIDVPQAGNHLRGIVLALGFAPSTLASIIDPLADLDPDLCSKFIRSLDLDLTASTNAPLAALLNGPGGRPAPSGAADQPIAEAIRTGASPDGALEAMAAGKSDAGVVRAVFELAVHDNTALDRFRAVLLRVLHDGVEVQVGALNELASLVGALKDDDVAVLFRKLYELDLVLEPALLAWRDRGANERVLAALAPFFAFLKDAPADDDL